MCWMKKEIVVEVEPRQFLWLATSIFPFPEGKEKGPTEKLDHISV